MFKNKPHGKPFSRPPHAQTPHSSTTSTTSTSATSTTSATTHAPPQRHHKKLSVSQLINAIRLALKNEDPSHPFPQINFSIFTSDSPMNKKFKSFVQYMLQYGTLTKDDISDCGFLTSELFNLFLLSISHMSVDCDWNMETLAFAGKEVFLETLTDFIAYKDISLFMDKVSNVTLTFAVDNFITNGDYYTKLVATSKTKDGKEVKINLTDFIAYRQLTYDIVMTERTDKITITIDENMKRQAFFAFLGAIQTAVNQFTPEAGAYVVKRILQKFVFTPTTDIETDWSKTTESYNQLQSIKSNRFTFKMYPVKRPNSEETSHIEGTLTVDNQTFKYRSDDIYGHEHQGRLKVASEMLKTLQSFNIVYKQHHASIDSHPPIPLSKSELANIINVIQHAIQNLAGAFTDLTPAQFIQRFIDDEAIYMITRAFTHKDIDRNHNYEVYEMIGDKTLNTTITQYIFKHNPQIIGDPHGLKMLTEAAQRYHGESEVYKLSDMLKLSDIARYDRAWYDKFTRNLSNAQRAYEHAPNSRTKKDLDVATKEYAKHVHKLKTDFMESFCFLIQHLVRRKLKAEESPTLVSNFIISSILYKLLDQLDVTVDLKKNISVSQQVKEIINKLRGEMKVNKDTGEIFAEFESTQHCGDTVFKKMTWPDAESAMVFFNTKCKLDWSPTELVKLE